MVPAVRDFVAAMLIALAAACTAAGRSDSNAYISHSGNESVDAFVAAVQRRDESRVADLTYKFETISGVFPQYKTAGEYLTRIRTCKINRVVQAGSDIDGEPVYIDRSIKDGPNAASTSYIYWIMWVCPNGSLRQALNADFHAPRLLVSELLPPARELPIMGPPNGS